MGKTREIFKKIKRYQGNISCKMGTIKDRNGMNLTEAEVIKATVHRRSMQKRSS